VRPPNHEARRPPALVLTAAERMRGMEEMSAKFAEVGMELYGSKSREKREG
jgi:hypothetical protein